MLYLTYVQELLSLTVNVSNAQEQTFAAVM